jgi:hypothetical protein
MTKPSPRWLSPASSQRMRRTFLRAALAAVLVGLGWTARAAQSQPDFELVVNAPAGATSIECRRGCELRWVERGPNPNAAPQQTFDFKCSGANAVSCSSGRVGGWIKR